MQWEGNLRKLETASQPNHHGQVAYALLGADVLEALPAEEMNAWVGEQIHIQFEGQIHCRVTGQTIRKAYGEGMSYQAWSEHPAAVESVMRP